MTFVDDEATAIVPGSASALISSLQKVAQAIINVFSDYAMSVNFGKGRTECTAAVRGTPASVVKEQLAAALAADGAHLLRDETTKGPSNVSLRVVGSYKHLGAFITTSGNLAGT